MSFWFHLEKLAPSTGHNWLVLTIYFVPASNRLLAVSVQWQGATIFQSPLNSDTDLWSTAVDTAIHVV